MKRVFIVNPKSGRGHGPDRVAALEAFFQRRGEPFDAVVTVSREDIIERTSEALQGGAEQIVAVGGDGTLNAVVNGFFDHGRPLSSEASLAVARVGSGSDYFRSLVGKTKHDWREIVLDPVIRPVDVAVCQPLHDRDLKPWYFINGMGFGMSAEVVRRKQGLPGWLPRSLSYLLPTIPNLFRAKRSDFHLQADDRSIDGEAVAVFAAKGTFAGGGMRFGGGVTLDDGRLDVTIFKPIPAWRMLLNTPKLYTGDFADNPAIEKVYTSRLRVEAEPIAPAECDGELLGSTGLEITVLRRAIRVGFPQVGG